MGDDYQKERLRPGFLSGLLETCTTIDRSITGRLEWYLCLNSALSTRHGVHLPITAITVSLLLPVGTARLASGWFVFKPLLCIKLLLTSCKDELYSTLPARYRLVFIGHFPYSFNFRLPNCSLWLTGTPNKG